jgi:GNAT superfamily N-acetyltransferase
MGCIDPSYHARVNGAGSRAPTGAAGHHRIESLADHPELLEQAGLLRFKEWAYGSPDPAPFIDVTARESGPAGELPMTLVAIDAAGDAAGVVGLGPIDDELSAAELGGRTPWILGMVVRAESRKLGVGRELLESLQHVAASLGYLRTWVATGGEAVGFYERCGWTAAEQVRLESTGVLTTILTRPTAGLGPD